jgi:hypothetical protein
VPSQTREPGSALAAALNVARDKKWLFLALSGLVVLPCLWHRHIEAGDLGSHVYNAWLAQLIGKGQAPGLYLVSQWNNVLFDVSLLHVANVVGLAAAERIVVSLCVLIFFWGVFAFVGAVTGRAPWFLTPCIAMLAYGYSFSMGFMNYYLSVGLACFGLALVWRGWAGNWLAALVVAALVLLAHPLGFVWLVGTLAYCSIRRILPEWWKLVLPFGLVCVLVGFRWYLHKRADLGVDWGAIPFYMMNGADQLALYGQRYVTLAWVALICGCVCFLAEAARRGKDVSFWRPMALPLELYFVAFCATALLPENLRVPLYSAWIGLLVSRLTTISAILGLCVLGYGQPRKSNVAGFSAIAMVFFLFLYQDTAILNRMEAHAESVLSGWPYGTRIIATIFAEPDWRVEFIGHLADRACIGHCFVYSNYEPSSKQFRVRARKGSPTVTDSSDDSEDMQGGAYEIQDTDPPLKQLYQCDAGDRTKLCLRDLAEGDNTGAVGLRPQR